MKRTHGQSRERIYFVWNAMVLRCTDDTKPDFCRYGGRGIKVCDRWMDFGAFFADMGTSPGPGYSLDRIDNDGDYEPKNVRWATVIQQANNKRTTHLVEYRGERVSIAQAVRSAGGLVLRETARNRISRGWPVQAAVETPNAFRRDPITRRVIEGVHHTIMPRSDLP